MVQAAKTADVPARRGTAQLAKSLRSMPLVSSAHLGWRDMAVCCWRADVAEYSLDDVPETLIALHTEGVVRRRGRQGWGPDRSVPGRVTVLPPGTCASFQGGGVLGVTTIHIGGGRLDALLPGDEARQALAAMPMQFGIVDPLIAAGLGALADEVWRPGVQGALYAEAIADSLTLHVLRAAHRFRAAPRRSGGLREGLLRRVQERIEADLGAALSIDDLAREAGLSRYHFSRAFRAATGLTPHRYLLGRRIERAKALLRADDMPIAEVALLTGFSSQSHLTDSFRQHVGVAPGEYRRTH